MKKHEIIPKLVKKLVEELTAIQQDAVTLVTVNLRINPAYMPKEGYNDSIYVEGELKRVNEQQGSQPVSYFISCIEN
ncbi:hypothetical protein [Chitinophaga sp. Cy-1792]|uniref:hypothetical protein n=1 Tax=Chitinophaga sp. Cy-1792 TaxID=2608339 RepID=UPI00141F18EE|nr:hypothetical protein [Chitinophaga sp. Cy-1792]NIG53067.1 hypothetical protein [Chitinophaga sp. Cy-1792]